MSAAPAMSAAPLDRRWPAPGRCCAAAGSALTVYLPIILMGLMALGTYWLARNTPALGARRGASARPTHDPDYFMRGFSVKTFDATGRLKSEVYGTEARHYPDTDTLEIDQPRIRSFNDRGELTVATARRALSNARRLRSAAVRRRGGHARGRHRRAGPARGRAWNSAASSCMPSSTPSA